MIIKLDLSKEYDNISWLFIRLIMIHKGCRIPLDYFNEKLNL